MDTNIHTYMTSANLYMIVLIYIFG